MATYSITQINIFDSEIQYCFNIVLHTNRESKVIQVKGQLIFFFWCESTQTYGL
jgi:hypothetical protein